MPDKEDKPVESGMEKDGDIESGMEKDRRITGCKEARGDRGIESLEDLFTYERALVFGIGGGGDVVGGVPTARLLELHGIDVILGGITWERHPYDPEPGPRSLDEIENIDRINDTVGLANSETKTARGVEFTETRVARHYSEEVVLIDPSSGPEKTSEGIMDACDELGIDLVVGTDSGGDVLAEGDEEGLRSPLADSVVLSCLENIETDSETGSAIGVFGYGSDGELSLEELDDGVSRAAERDGWLGSWGLSREVVEEMKDLLETVGTTEASRLPVEVAEGGIGEKKIRNGERSLKLSPMSALTLYFTPSSVVSTSEPAQKIRDSGSLSEANEILENMGLRTELGYEWSKKDEE